MELVDAISCVKETTSCFSSIFYLWMKLICITGSLFLLDCESFNEKIEVMRERDRANERKFDGEAGWR